MGKERALVDTLRKRLNEKSPLIQVVIGPRQVGKTTALKAALEKRGVFENADSPTPLSHVVIEEWWARAAKSTHKILAIDEVQKIPGWTEVLKKLWDAQPKKLKVIVTGSSALLVEKGLKETLAGRFELIRAEHWNFEEAHRIFGMTDRDFVEFGAYPGAMPLIEDKERWSAYIRDSIVEPAIGRDLLQLHPVDNPALLRHVFGLAMGLPGEVISLQKLQGQLQTKGAIATIQNYLRLLSDSFLVSGVEKYSDSPLRVKKSSPKIIVHDNALMRAFMRPVGQKLNSEKFGRYFENSVGARFVEACWSTYYWKDRDVEVDFVVLGPNGEKWAVEVKTSKTTLDELKGLRSFCQHHPEFEPCLVSWIDQKVEGIRTLDRHEILSLKQ